MKKTYPIIKVGDHLYAVDKDERAKQGWNYNTALSKPEELSRNYEEFSSEWIYCMKIVATNNPSLKGDWEIVGKQHGLQPTKGVLQLPPIEEGIHKDAYPAYEEFMRKNKGEYEFHDEWESDYHSDGFVWGYTKAAQSKGQYSEEDIKTAMFKYAAWLTGGPQSLSKAKDADEAQNKIIKSLSKVPKYIEVEIDAIPADRAPNGWDEFPKNNNGVVVGEYIYEEGH